MDGVDVREYDQKALRNKIGYISQKAILFSGTVKSNVAYGDNGKEEFLDEDVVDAVYTAEASEFVEKMVGTYDARIAQGGSNLSGGQKTAAVYRQAICRHPEILIFDDSFSALDYRTDRQVRENLNRECGKRHAADRGPADRNHPGRGQDHRTLRRKNRRHGYP